ncbi:MAG: DUF1761 domain-containing protein [Reichenbachiella sp.]|uniref:DUF1761 domain-containing protein n=1 Tax=Reichenbachiella sp. TaxID=2184521 RepID=UPI00326473D6
MKTQKINHVAVWVLVAIIQVIPMLWYDQLFFGIRWMELNNFTIDDFDDFGTFGYVIAILNAAAFCYFMAWLFIRLKVETAIEGLKIAFLLWFCLVFMQVTTQNFFTLRPFELTLIDELLVLIEYEMVGVVLALLRKYESVEAKWN